MYFLRELVRTARYNSDPVKVFTQLVARCNELHLYVERQDPGKGEVVIRCLTLAFNLFLWRCWSDKIVLRISAAEGNGSRLNVFAIPNLRRWKIKAGERVIDLGELSRRLTEPMQ